MEVNLTGKGIGKALVLFARQDNCRKISKDLTRLKECLESAKE